MDIKAWEVKVNLYFLKDIHITNIGENIGKLINFAMLSDDTLKEVHTSTGFKNYVFSNPTNVVNGYYKQDSIGEFKIRSCNKEMLEKLEKVISKVRNDEFIVLKTNLYSIESKGITGIKTITPTVLTFKTTEINEKIKKDNKRSLRNFNWIKGCNMKILHERMENNLKRKYKSLCGEEPPSELAIIDNIKIQNEFPIKIRYKNNFFLGNKFEIEFAKNDMTDTFVNIALGSGLLEKNSALGCGFCIPVRGEA